MFKLPVVQPDLTESTISRVEEPECRAVSGDLLGRYLYLAIEQGWRRDAEKQRYHTAKLAAELTESQSESKPESSPPNAQKLINSATIKELLRMFELSVDDWQTVTARADIGDLQRAARSLEALQLGLTTDAMLIAGDIGGTKTRIGLFERRAGRVEIIVSEQYASKDFASLEDILALFLKTHAGCIKGKLAAACFGLPGPVVNERVKVTNLPWEVVHSNVCRQLDTHSTKLVNDLVSTAAAIPSFEPENLQIVYGAAGMADKAASCAVVAPGTGIGHSLIHREAGCSVLLASEGGHANFAPTNDLEIELLKYLQSKLPHVSVESVLSGPGLLNIHSFLKDTKRGVEPAEDLQVGAPLVTASVIVQRALAGSCDLSVQTIEIFCHILGAHCSNIALTYLSIGGIYLGGGIPPKIAKFLTSGKFLEGYLKKGKQLERVEATPVFIIKDDYAALYGSAAIASTL
jgi:glucokinase